MVQESVIQDCGMHDSIMALLGARTPISEVQYEWLKEHSIEMTKQPFPSKVWMKGGIFWLFAWIDESGTYGITGGGMDGGNPTGYVVRIR